MRQTELIGASYSYTPSYAEMEEMGTVFHVVEEASDGSIVNMPVLITNAERRILDSIVMRLYAEHNRYIQKVADEDGIMHLIMKVQVELPDGVLPKKKA